MDPKTTISNNKVLSSGSTESSHRKISLIKNPTLKWRINCTNTLSKYINLIDPTSQMSVLSMKKQSIFITGSLALRIKKKRKIKTSMSNKIHKKKTNNKINNN